MINGVQIRYEVEGSGPVVAFTPGGFWPLEEGRPFAEALRALGFRVVLYDRPNCGASGFLFDGSESIYHVFADCLHGLLDDLGLLPCCIAGASAGAVTALSFAHRHPGAATALALFSPPTDDAAAWQGIARATFLQPARLAEMCGMPAVAEISLGLFDFPTGVAMNPDNRPALLAMNPSEFASVLRRWGRSCGSGREHVAGLSDQEISGLGLPTLVLAGPDPRTGLHPRHTAERLHQLIRGSRLVIPYEALPAEEAQKVRARVEEGGGRWYDAALAPFVKGFLLGPEGRKAGPAA